LFLLFTDAPLDGKTMHVMFIFGLVDHYAVVIRAVHEDPLHLSGFPEADGGVRTWR
jgi:hypothetical protein